MSLKDDSKKKNKITKLLTTTSLSDIININKWWEETNTEENNKEESENENENETNRWNNLEHNGVLFPPSYIPHNIKILYKNSPINLNPEQEEIATFWAGLLESDISKKPIAIKNFSKEFKSYLPEEYKNSDFSDFDFTPIQKYLQEMKQKNKNKTSEEKKQDKIKRQKLMDYYGWAIVDGSLEKLSNFLVEPPGIFRGRGEQPLTGKLKKRIFPEDITINIGKNDPVPICSQKGHNWGEIVNNNESTWLAYYKVGKNTKYVFLASNSKFKGMSDYKKYEKARKLKNSIETIRNDYYKKLKDVSNSENNQLGAATYLIDRLALRVGNEKGEDEADTVGCCTLRVEHITLEEDNYITFDFLAKDSMRYLNRVQIEEIVYKNLEKFVKGKNKEDDLFDLINATKLNEYLKELMPGLSAKVFRTYNASFVLQQQLNKKNFSDDKYSIEEKVAYYNEANKQVAIMCNHQRTVPKNYNLKSEEMSKDLENHKTYLNELEEFYNNKKSKKKYVEETIGKLKKVFPNDKEKLKKLITNLKEKIKKMDIKLKEREDNKQVALGTSKLNYMDPRITVSLCKKFEVNIEKIFSKSIRDKFPWAMYVDPDYQF